MTHNNTTPAEAIRVAAGTRVTTEKAPTINNAPDSLQNAERARRGGDMRRGDAGARGVSGDLCRKTFRAHQQNNARQEIKIEIYTLMVLAANIEYQLQPASA